MNIYKIVEEHLNNPECGCYTTFGICVYNDKTNETVCCVSDVFLEKERATEFVRICNESNLDIVHLPSVIENYL